MQKTHAHARINKARRELTINIEVSELGFCSIEFYVSYNRFIYYLCEYAKDIHDQKEGLISEHDLRLSWFVTVSHKNAALLESHEDFFLQSENIEDILFDYDAPEIEQAYKSLFPNESNN